MEVILGKTAGFCPGVINAITKTEEILKNEDKKIYCLGELVHNRQVIQHLENMGLETIEKIDEVKNKEKVIIRAHGITKEVYEYAKNNNIKLVDLTCPKVLKIHKQAEALAEKGYFIILIAQKNHPEAIGTISFCGKFRKIIENIEEVPSIIKEINKSKKKKVAIISQTTFSMKKFEEICESLKENLEADVNLEIYNTICNATSLRQKETAQIAEEVEAMIIIGGKNSSNTKKLYEIAKESCPNTFLIETKDELDIKQMNKFNKIGIMAGASTPNASIEEVVEIFRT